MPESPLRYEKFLKLLPENNFNVTKTALEAGFTKETAHKQQKRLLKSALKYQAQKHLDLLKGNTDVSLKEMKTMAEQVGFSREDLMNNLKWLATQEKDLGTRLKVVAPLVKEFGVDLSTEENNKTIAPVLNITVKEKEQTLHNGPVEPYLDIDPME